MDDFVSARGTEAGEILGEGADFASGEDTANPSYDGPVQDGQAFFPKSVLEDLDAEVGALDNPPSPEDEPQAKAEPAPEFSDSDKAAAYAAIIYQTTKMIVVPQGAPPPDMADCLALAVSIVDTEKFFPNVNPVDPKWMAVASLGIAGFTFYSKQKEAVRSANAVDVTPQGHGPK